LGDAARCRLQLAAVSGLHRIYYQHLRLEALQMPPDSFPGGLGQDVQIGRSHPQALGAQFNLLLRFLPGGIKHPRPLLGQGGTDL